MRIGRRQDAIVEARRSALLARDRRARRPRASSAACATIVDARADGRRPRARCASRDASTASRPPLEVSQREMTREAARVPRRRPARHRAGRRATSRASPPARSRSTSTSTVAPGVSVEQRVEPLARVGCYVPGGRFPLPSSLLMTAVPARVAGVARDHRGLPAAGAGRDGGGARGRRHAAVSHRRRARDRRARVRHRRRVPRVDKIVGPGNRYVAAAKALVAGRLRHRLLRRTDRDRRSSPAADGRTGSPRISSRRPSTIPTRGDLHHLEPRARRARRRRRSPTRAPGATSSRSRSPRTAPIIVTRHADEAMALANRLAPEHLVVDREALIAAAADRRRGLRRPVHRAGRRRLRDRLESRAADLRRRALPRRPERGRFRPRDVGAAGHARRARAARADDPAARARRRTRRRTPNRSRSRAAMKP